MVMLLIPHSAVTELAHEPFYLTPAALMLLNIRVLAIPGKGLYLL